MKNAKKENMRESNFELLRIICMIVIIVFHIYTQTDASELTPENGIPYFIIVLIGYGGRLVCNCFVMIGAWFLCDAQFKPERIVNLWLQVFFYTSSITVVCTFLGVPEASIVTLVQSFLPVMGRPVWFAAEYICMLMLSPFLNMLVKQQDLICRKLLVILGILIIGCATLFPIEHTTPAFSELLWFIYLYLFVAYFKKNPLQIMNRRRICVFMAVIFYFISVISYVMLKKMGVVAADYYRDHYENFFSFIISLLLFYIFKNMHIGRNKLINTIAESTFAVYVIHQTPCFYPILWNGIFEINKNVYNSWLVIYIIFIVITIFIVAVVTEKIREVCFERLIYTSKVYQLICYQIRKFYELDIKL